MYIYIDDELEQAIPIIDHIEIDHEREMPYYKTSEELEKVHNEMHQISNHWGHKH